MPTRHNLYGWHCNNKQMWYYRKYCNKCEAYRQTSNPFTDLYCPLCGKKMRLRPHKTIYDIELDLTKIPEYIKQQKQK